MQIRTATLSDVNALSDLLSILFTQEIEFTPDTQAQVRGLTRIITHPEIGEIFVASDDEQVLGMVSLLYSVSTALGAEVATLEDMIVAPQARGHGIGDALLQHAIHHAKARGCKRITLLTDQTNLAAQGFYAKQGFSISLMSAMRLLID
jgi:ribosomal protein S18 acetylase RimI-like enzyme